MYEQTDRILNIMREEFIRLFGNFKGILANFDELKILNESKLLYRQLDQVARAGFLEIGQRAYVDNEGIYRQGNKIHPAVLDDTIDYLISEIWLADILRDYDPVSKYVYVHEVERKQARFAESVIASQDRAGAVDTGLRYWNGQASWYAIRVTDEAVIEAYKSRGVEFVKWYTVEDERTCETCMAMHGKVYPIDKIPPKPHLGCRCYVLPHKGGKSE